MRSLRAALFLIFLLAAAIPGTIVNAQSATYVYAPQFVDGNNHPLVGVTVILYNHGAAQNPGNVIASGTTDSTGHLTPGVTLEIGSVYDFTTSSAAVPLGQFTATAPRQLVLIPGPAGPTGAPGAPGAAGPPQNIVAASSNVTIGTPSANTFSIAVASPAPITPVAGTNIAITGTAAAPQINVTDTVHLLGGLYTGTGGNYGDNGSPTANGGLVAWSNGSGVAGQMSYLLSSNNPNNAVAGIQGKIEVLSDSNGSYALRATDPAGNLGIYGFLSSSRFAGNSCLKTIPIASAGGTSAGGGQVVESGAPCISSLTASTNIAIGGTSAAPTIAVIPAPSFAGSVSGGNFKATGLNPYFTTPGGASLSYQAFSAGANDVNNPYALIIQNSGPNGSNTILGTNAMQTVSGVPGTCLAGANQNGHGDLLASLISLDCSGNLGISGAYTSASSRHLKDHISPFATDELRRVLHSTKIVKYCYKVEHCKPNETREVGFIADDTSSLLAGSRHDHIDLGTMASVSFAAAQYNDRRISDLESVVYFLRISVVGLFIAVMIIFFGFVYRNRGR